VEEDNGKIPSGPLGGTSKCNDPPRNVLGSIETKRNNTIAGLKLAKGLLAMLKELSRRKSQNVHDFPSSDGDFTLQSYAEGKCPCLPLVVVKPSQQVPCILSSPQVRTVERVKDMGLGPIGVRNCKRETLMQPFATLPWKKPNLGKKIFNVRGSPLKKCKSKARLNLTSTRRNATSTSQATKTRRKESRNLASRVKVEGHIAIEDFDKEIDKFTSRGEVVA
jgi:hypothetical protein